VAILGGKILAQWQCERDGQLHTDAAYTPLVQLIKDRQDAKDANVTAGRTNMTYADHFDAFAALCEDSMVAAAHIQVCEHPNDFGVSPNDELARGIDSLENLEMLASNLL
jgi:hypothetical protein